MALILFIREGATVFRPHRELRKLFMNCEVTVYKKNTPLSSGIVPQHRQLFHYLEVGDN